MWALVLIEDLLHRHAINLLGKNLCLYLPIEAWSVMSLVIYTYKELERLKYFSHTLTFKYKEQIGLPSSLF